MGRESSHEQRVRNAVLTWARTCDRPLPWRGERDPYRVLVSEVMLQQTQAARVAEAYPAFLRRFPTVAVLAAAPAADVLRAWGSLGYHRRALNLWRAVREIADRGSFPRSVDELERLPGIGPYTARAVACFAFGQDTAAVDTNVRRIFSRLHGLPAHADVRSLAQQAVPEGKAAVWTQALMDLGATVCLPRSPDCASCPLERECAWARGVRAPAPKRRPSVPFEQTTRYARGRVVRALKDTPGELTVSALTSATGLDAERVEAAVTALEADGIVTTRRRRVSLGDGYNARSRSRSTSLTT